MNFHALVFTQISIRKPSLKQGYLEYILIKRMVSCHSSYMLYHIDLRRNSDKKKAKGLEIVQYCHQPAAAYLQFFWLD